MASLVNNAVFTATSAGTAAFVVSAPVTGYVTPANATPPAVDGKIYRYRAQSTDLSQWEEGNAVSSGTATSFTRVVSSSSAGGTTTVNFTIPPAVALTMTAADVLQFDDAMSLTIAQQTQARSNIAADFPSGTVMLFYQATAPTGWTKLTTQNDKALRVVSGSGGVSGGTNAFSTVMAQTVGGSTALSASQIPSITSSVTQTITVSTGAYSIPGSTSGVASSNTGSGSLLGPYSSGGWANAGSSFSGSNTINVTSNNTGAASHNHTIAMSIQYIDLILASKN